MRKLLAALCLALGLALAAPNAAAEAYGSGWYREVQASFGYEDNIARTFLSDETSDVISTVSIGGGYATKVGRTAQLVVSAYLVNTRHQDIDALNNRGVSLGFDYTFQPVPSYGGAWYKIKFDATDFTYPDSPEREGIQLRAEFSGHKRLTTEITGHLGFRAQSLEFSGKSSAEEQNDAAFETDSREVFIALDYFVRPGVFIFTEYARRQGDIRTTVSGGLRTGFEYDAETIDPAFTPDCVGGCSYAYRQEGKTDVISAGFTYPILGSAMDLSLNHFRANGDNRKTYRDTLVQLGFVWTF